MITYSVHALMRMRERGVTREEVENVLLHPLAVRRDSVWKKGGLRRGLPPGKYTIVIFEQSDEDFIVVTAMKVDKERLERYGFTGVR